MKKILILIMYFEEITIFATKKKKQWQTKLKENFTNYHPVIDVSFQEVEFTKFMMLLKLKNQTEEPFIRSRNKHIGEDMVKIISQWTLLTVYKEVRSCSNRGNQITMPTGDEL